MDFPNMFAVILVFSCILELSLQDGTIKFTPPARVFCKDDEDITAFCPSWKDKGYCQTKRALMVAACSETCEYCSKEKFSKKIDDIIKDQQVIQKVTGDLEKTEEGLEQGNASPSAQGSFQGSGNTPAQQEATEVPNGPKDNEANETGGEPDIPDTAKIPGSPEAVKKPGSPEGAKIPGISEAAKKPGSPEGAKKPDCPEAVKKPGSLEGAKIPGIPEATKKPGSQEGAKIPGIPEAIKKPDSIEEDEKPESEKDIFTPKPEGEKEENKPEGKKNPEGEKKPECPEAAKKPGSSEAAKKPGSQEGAKIPGILEAAKKPDCLETAKKPGSPEGAKIHGITEAAKKPGSPEESEPVEAPPSGKVGSTNGCDEACQKECIDAHNKYRANHDAPPLTFDQTLADQAQAHADRVATQNKFMHSDWASGKGGECIGWGWVKPSWTIAVKDWHDEEKDYDYNTGKSKNGKAIGHFTQVVWKKAKKAGCAKSMMNGAPFYITQMDVVGIVTDTLPGYEKENVGLPKKPDLEWFKDMRKKQMKANGQKRSIIPSHTSKSHFKRKRVSKFRHTARISKRMEPASNKQIMKVRISVKGKMKEKHQWIVEDN